eukprot:TRINITY_DN1962_c0_g1_i3.p1 TRINITY_DN1962_c0_g1~~TRINITY_DN1962_c0_g1_i3.p1  ORF type:complete len:827 (+),score=261.77 TRINITY_DN1962_c0_g1_i3:413-2893(+)
MIPIEDHLQLVEEEISKRTNQLTNIFQQKLRQETLNSDHQKRLISKEHAKDMEALMREYDVKIAGLNRKLNENRNNLDRIVKLEDDIALSDNHVTRLERKIGDARLLLRAQNDAAVRAQKMIDKRHREEIIQYQETVRGLEKKVNELEESLLKKGITAEPRRVAFPASGPASKPRIRRAPQQVMSALGAINLLASGNDDKNGDSDEGSVTSNSGKPSNSMAETVINPSGVKASGRTRRGSLISAGRRNSLITVDVRRVNGASATPRRNSVLKFLDSDDVPNSATTPGNPVSEGSLSETASVRSDRSGSDTAESTALDTEPSMLSTVVHGLQNTMDEEVHRELQNTKQLLAERDKECTKYVERIEMLEKEYEIVSNRSQKQEQDLVEITARTKRREQELELAVEEQKDKARRQNVEQQKNTRAATERLRQQLEKTTKEKDNLQTKVGSINKMLESANDRVLRMTAKADAADKMKSDLDGEIYDLEKELQKMRHTNRTQLIELKKLRRAEARREERMAQIRREVDMAKDALARDAHSNTAKHKKALRDVKNILCTIKDLDQIVSPDVSCPVCQRVMRKPKTLYPCGHSFCEQCLVVAPDGTGFTCSVCMENHITEVVAPNIALDSLCSRYSWWKIPIMSLNLMFARLADVLGPALTVGDIKQQAFVRSLKEAIQRKFKPKSLIDLRKIGARLLVEFMKFCDSDGMWLDTTALKRAFDAINVAVTNDDLTVLARGVERYIVAGESQEVNSDDEEYDSDEDEENSEAMKRVLSRRAKKDVFDVYAVVSWMTSSVEQEAQEEQRLKLEFENEKDLEENPKVSTDVLLGIQP